MIKGCNHHVLPDSSGWCVISESNQKVVTHFDSRENAMAFASQCAQDSEGMVLLHNSPVEATENFSTVSLPQQENLPDRAYLNAQDGLEMKQQIDFKEQVQEPEFDPLLGFDEYYFEL